MNEKIKKLMLWDEDAVLDEYNKFSKNTEEVLDNLYENENIRIFHLMDKEYYNTREDRYTYDRIDLLRDDVTREYFGLAIIEVEPEDFRDSSTYNIEVRRIISVDDLLSFTMSYKADIDNLNAVRIIQREIEGLDSIKSF